ncbi:group II intron maturase-specific domain-containing protein [Saccharopolyspora spinosa]|uniref:group II intron maturase-specific domain-containing protein n=1 Tax=Saccharopolyspora spinosa TaxID=60894 RepID=UPI003748F652
MESYPEPDAAWKAYFRYGCPNATFSYLRSYLWKEVVRWQERKHRRTPWKQLRRRYGIQPADGDVGLFDPEGRLGRRAAGWGRSADKILTTWHYQDSSWASEIRRGMRNLRSC